ncbi:Myosin light chain kinase [Phytophthora citrophthora]|uniref:Myosin light chain kinase n=1 Tax=Phytophthora citrophthora TaxID=4793 RepID=A0AAD9GA13_9STRA|nr:Myosin light chain kinase [Phytophthora citrophthora]
MVTAEIASCSTLDTIPCIGSAKPFTATICKHSADPDAESFSDLFGFEPYVTVHTYTTGYECTSSFQSVTVYLADGNCHKTNAQESFVAKRAPDGSARVSLFANDACSDIAVSVLSQTRDEHTCVVGRANDTVIRGGGDTATRVHLQTKGIYESHPGNCQSPAIPVHVTTTMNAVHCVDSCSSESPFISSRCTTGTYASADSEDDFSQSPFVTVQEYASGSNCALVDLTAQRTYLADNKCHVTTTLTSFRAKITQDGLVSIDIYTDSACTSDNDTLVVSAFQSDGFTCVEGDANAPDIVIYGEGETPVHLTSLAVYDTKQDCETSSLPGLQIATLGDPDECEVSALHNCVEASAPYTSISCTSLENFVTDVIPTFGDNSYVVVEKYRDGEGCDDASKLSSISAYSANGKCHVTDVGTNFEANVTTEGVVKITMYTTSADCSKDGVVSEFTSEQTTTECLGVEGTSGIADTKIYWHSAKLTPTETAGPDNFDGDTLYSSGRSGVGSNANNGIGDSYAPETTSDNEGSLDSSNLGSNTGSDSGSGKGPSAPEPTPTISILEPAPTPMPTADVVVATPTPTASQTTSPVSTPIQTTAVAPQPTPTPSASVTASPVSIPTPSPVVPPQPTPTPSASVTASPVSIPTLSPVVPPQPTPTPSASVTIGPVLIPTPTIAVAPQPTPTPTVSVAVGPIPAPSAVVPPSPPTPTVSVVIGPISTPAPTTTVPPAVPTPPTVVTPAPIPAPSVSTAVRPSSTPLTVVTPSPISTPTVSTAERPSPTPSTVMTPAPISAPTVSIAERPSPTPSTPSIPPTPPIVVTPAPTPAQTVSAGPNPTTAAPTPAPTATAPVSTAAGPVSTAPSTITPATTTSTTNGTSAASCVSTTITLLLFTAAALMLGI